MASPQARGVVYIHSAPRALCPHLEWAVGRALGRGVNFDWTDQPVLNGSRRAEYYWEGTAGTGAALATAIRGWEHLRFEVTEDPTPRSEGGRGSEEGRTGQGCREEGRPGREEGCAEEIGLSLVSGSTRPRRERGFVFQTSTPPATTRRARLPPIQ